MGSDRGYAGAEAVVVAGDVVGPVDATGDVIDVAVLSSILALKRNRKKTLSLSVRILALPCLPSTHALISRGYNSRRGNS